MATSLEGSKKEVQIKHLRTNTFHLVKEILKIGPVNPDIIGLQDIIKNKNKIKRAKINTSQTYSPVGQVCRAD